MRARYKGLLFGLAYGLATISLHLPEYLNWSGERFGHNLSQLLTSLFMPALMGMAIGYFVEWRKKIRG